SSGCAYNAYMEATVLPTAATPPDDVSTAQPATTQLCAPRNTNGIPRRKTLINADALFSKPMRRLFRSLNTLRWQLPLKAA
ncbi:hypothetical protein AAVH_38434, partial [Aphelenchoides avenae]